MKETEFFYEPCVDEAQTIRNMKRQLLFLKQYTASLRLHSVLYGEDCVQLQVEDELSDYLNYTRSIVQTSRNGGYVHRDPVLDAMERQRRVREKVMAVSYTHLDVYKRQGTARLRRKQSQKAAGIFDFVERCFIINQSCDRPTFDQIFISFFEGFITLTHSSFYHFI